MFSRKLTLAFAFLGMMATSIFTVATAATLSPAQSVEINDQVLAGGNAIAHLPAQPHYAVEQMDGKKVVVVKYWNEYQKKMVTGSIVPLDANNQFQPDGMRWKFTLTPDGYLTWEEVKK